MASFSLAVRIPAESTRLSNWATHGFIFRVAAIPPQLRERPAMERDVYLYITDVAEFCDDVQRRGANILQEPYERAVWHPRIRD